jgi:CRP-like cAMP-binding protein
MGERRLYFFISHGTARQMRVTIPLSNFHRPTEASNSVSSGVATLLLATATDRQIVNGLVRTTLVLTNEDIAQMIGTSRETISRTLSLERTA